MENEGTAEMMIRELRERGHRTHAVVDDSRFSRLVEALGDADDVVETSAADLRFIEGLADLPYGFLKDFNVRFEGSADCSCGRRLSAADVVGSALRGQVHSRELISRTLAAMQNLVELSQGGRAGACLGCGRSFVAATYWTSGYAYA